MTGTGAFPPIHNIKKQSVATIAKYNYQALRNLARNCDASVVPLHVVNMKETVGSLVVVRSIMLRDVDIHDVKKRWAGRMESPH